MSLKYKTVYHSGDPAESEYFDLSDYVLKTNDINILHTNYNNSLLCPSLQMTLTKDIENLTTELKEGSG